LHRAGIANQAEAISLKDGLCLTGVAITPICHCAPPGNKPLGEELENCKPYLDAILFSRKWKSILCLGNLAWNALHKAYHVHPIPKFGHVVIAELRNGTLVVGSYHPSQQNTFTGRLTEEMLDCAVMRFLNC
jgi:uracil-DNA glycosylase family 4